MVERTEGVTASFLKELLRRAVLESLVEHTPLDTVTAAHVSRALDDLLDSTQQVTRSLLGVGNDPEDLPGGGGAGTLPPGHQGGWYGYGGMRGSVAHLPRLGRLTPGRAAAAAAIWGAISRRARPRWEIASLSAGSSSAVVRPGSSTASNSTS